MKRAISNYGQANYGQWADHCCDGPTVVQRGRLMRPAALRWRWLD